MDGRTEPVSRFAVLRNLASRAIGRRRSARRLDTELTPAAEEVIRSQPGLTEEERATLRLLGSDRAIELARALGRGRVSSEECARRLRERFERQAQRLGTTLRNTPFPQSRAPAVIMLVDDEPSILRVMVRMLEQAGHEVLSCRSFEEAKNHLDEGIKPDLLITDVVLNGSTGKRVAAAVNAVSPKTKMIFMSGYANIAIGGHPVLQKPFKRQELFELVDQALADREEPFMLSRRKH